MVLLFQIRQRLLLKLPKDQLKEIAEMKIPDLNAASIEAAIRMVAGTIERIWV